METNTEKKFWKNAWAILSFALTLAVAYFIFVYGGDVTLSLTRRNNLITIIVSGGWYVAWIYFVFVWALRLFSSIKAYKETGKFNTFFVPAKKDKDSRGI